MRLRGLLRRIVARQARNLRRDDYRRRRREQRSARPEAVPSAAEMASREELRRHIGEAMLALDEPYRTAIWLRYREELPPRDVASLLDVPVETVRTRIKRGLALLRSELDREHGSRDSWLSALAPIVLRGRKAAGFWGVWIMYTKSKIVAGSLLLAAMFGFWLWLYLTPSPTPAAEPPAAQLQADGGESADDAELATPDAARRELAGSSLSEEATTSLRVRVVDRASRDPIPGFRLAVLPNGPGFEPHEATTDERGEVLWEGVDWQRAMVVPARTPVSFFDIEPGRLNEHIHLVEVSFRVEGVVVDASDVPVGGAEVWTMFAPSSHRQRPRYRHARRYG